MERTIISRISIRRGRYRVRFTDDGHVGHSKTFDTIAQAIEFRDSHPNSKPAKPILPAPPQDALTNSEYSQWPPNKSGSFVVRWREGKIVRSKSFNPKKIPNALAQAIDWQMKHPY